MTPLQEEKGLLRKQLRQKVCQIPEPARLQLSLDACALLQSQEIWRRAEAVLFYVPLPFELNVRPLMEETLRNGRLVGLPRFNPERDEYEAVQVGDPEADCAPGKFGILEPGFACPLLDPNRLDLVLVPGVGFDWFGHRLGRGRGYYDRLLAGARGGKCGVAFEEQVMEAIPVEPHDVSMDCIVTPARWHVVSA
jgi:5-formyltetrahydrofolate cyclo-ligase